MRDGSFGLQATTCSIMTIPGRTTRARRALQDGDYRMLDSIGLPRVPLAQAAPLPMQLTLVVPDLLAAARGAPDRAAALARLARYAPAPAATPEGLDAALLVAAGGTRDIAVAPLAALGAGFDPGSAYVLRADPVAFVAGRDDVLIEGRVDDLADGDAAAMIATLNRHFARRRPRLPRAARRRVVR